MEKIVMEVKPAMNTLILLKVSRKMMTMNKMKSH